MKYTNYFRLMIGISLIFVGFTIESYLELTPAFAVVSSVFAFTFWFGAVMAPDSEKYTPEYLKKYKGWS